MKNDGRSFILAIPLIMPDGFVPALDFIFFRPSIGAPPTCRHHQNI